MKRTYYCRPSNVSPNAWQTRERQPYLPEAQAGQSLVEISLILPIVIVFLLIAANVGLGLRAHTSLTQATQQAAEYISHNPSQATSSGVASYMNSIASLSTPITSSMVTVTLSADPISTGSSSETVQIDTISIDYPFKLIAPLVGGFNWGPLRGGSLHLGSTVSTAAALGPPTLTCVYPPATGSTTTNCTSTPPGGQHLIQWTLPATSNPKGVDVNYCVYRTYLPQGRTSATTTTSNQRIKCLPGNSSSHTDASTNAVLVPPANSAAGQKNFTYWVTAIEADGIGSATSNPGYGQ